MCLHSLPASVQACTCPICRRTLDFISKDTQYDEMISVVAAAMKSTPVDEAAQPEKPEKTVETFYIDFSKGDKSAGVCVQTYQGPGVRISKVLKAGRFYDAGFRPDDLILDINGTCTNDVEPAVKVINAEQKRRGMLTVRVLRQCENGGVRVTFRELELPRKTTATATGKPELANNEYQADPGVWLEC